MEEFWSVGARKLKQVQPPTAKLEAHADELQGLQKQIMAFLQQISLMSEQGTFSEEILARCEAFGSGAHGRRMSRCERGSMHEPGVRLVDERH